MRGDGGPPASVATRPERKKQKAVWAGALTLVDRLRQREEEKGDPEEERGDRPGSSLPCPRVSSGLPLFPPPVFDSHGLHRIRTAPALSGVGLD